MNKEELKEFAIGFIIFILLIPLFVWQCKADERAIQHCINNVNTESYCTALLNGHVS